MTIDAFASPLEDTSATNGPKDAQRTDILVSDHNAKIFDIRRGYESTCLEKEIRDGLNVSSGVERTLPTLLLYDERGLKLFEDITYLEEYYLTNAEIDVLETYADVIAGNLPPESVILELGSGNLRKVNILLSALERQRKRVEYYALDLSLPELERTLAMVPADYKYVECFGLLGTYDDGLDWIQTPQTSGKVKTILSLGSSIGNFPRKDAQSFLKDYATLLREGDQMLMGIDGCKDPARVYRAYNDRNEVTHSFTLNGLRNANRMLGYEAFAADMWDACGQFNKERGCHQAFVSPRKDVEVCGITIHAGERVRFEESHKYDQEDLANLWHGACLTEKLSWTNARGDYAMHLLAPQNFYAFPTVPAGYAPQPAPTWDEWQHLWKIWDTVTRKMIPDEALHDKPINLRNACIFYLGHIPTFLDMKLAEAGDGNWTEPKNYPKMFERGIDPDVENPEKVHAHSEIPDDWPPLQEILTHQSRVRNRVEAMYKTGISDEMENARCLWLGYEHECMHLETLLYMLVQSDKTRPPPELPTPNFAGHAQQADLQAVPNEWVVVNERTLHVGMHDSEVDTGPSRYFGWDIEKPLNKTHVHEFEAKARPITNGEYAYFLQQSGRTDIPASWKLIEDSETQVNAEPVEIANGTENELPGDAVPEVDKQFLANKAVRTLYGPVPLSLALHWPVCASYNELSGCAAAMGGRIPTYEETKSIYQQADGFFSVGKADQASSRTIPAVNSHLINNGVPESPPSRLSSHDAVAKTATVSDGAERAPLEKRREDLFTNLEGANVGFQSWHPTPVTDRGNRLCGQSEMGGVWEWTSSPLRKPEGYEPMKLYKSYSRKFFLTIRPPFFDPDIVLALRNFLHDLASR
ncbi:MAG: hypothetical protein M1831_006590 [Alyxoria varia]|nr:MAG: hypothetical protein M1831_006590 [Alyxoria varia]